MKPLLTINPKLESKKIINFIERTFRQQKKEKAIIGLSGGVDSAVSFTLLVKALKPKQPIVLYLPYSLPFLKNRDVNYRNVKKLVKKIRLPKKNFFIIPIAKPTDKIIDLIKNAGLTRWQKFIYGANECFNCSNTSTTTRIRLGNVMTRIRMILLFDFAKKYNAMVCGTENKSEKLLGYFTRFGDAASDIEPISHLYKTQVIELAKFLKVPKEVINQKPTAGLWHGQTDEAEFGFTYQEADQVLTLYFDKKISTEKIRKKGYKNAKKILGFAKKNSFKQETPYCLK